MDTLFDTFKARAEAVSAEVHRFATRREAMDFILGLLQEQGVLDAPQAGALWADGAFLKGTGRKYLEAEAPGISFQVTREAAAAARVGISEVDWAVAATGTLVVDAAPVEQRLVSTLPPIHVALVGTARLREDLGAVLQRIHPGKTAYISLITGPSRTADIERVLTIGVHGPERLIVVFVDEFERETA
ncbi:MAG: lactate utilization protein [Holophaga sp.]|jgi:L-lactate dehydrogenase complex protein LldG